VTPAECPDCSGTGWTTGKDGAELCLPCRGTGSQEPGPDAPLLDHLRWGAAAVDTWPAWKREMHRRAVVAEDWFASKDGAR